MSRIDQLQSEAKKVNSSMHVAMVTIFFNASGPSNHHTKFGKLPVFINISKLRDFSIGFILWLEDFVNHHINLLENHLLSGFS